MTHGLFTVFAAQDATAADQLTELLMHAARAMADDPQCLRYEVGRTSAPDEVCVGEHWTDETARLASLQTDGVRDLITRAGPLLSTVRSQTSYRVLDLQEPPGH
jgi:quinol monooxygenase YgiN